MSFSPMLRCSFSNVFFVPPFLFYFCVPCALQAEPTSYSIKDSPPAGAISLRQNTAVGPGAAAGTLEVRRDPLKCRPRVAQRSVERPPSSCAKIR